MQEIMTHPLGETQTKGIYSPHKKNKKNLTGFFDTKKEIG